MHSLWILAGGFLLFVLWQLGVPVLWLGAVGAFWMGFAFNGIVHKKNAADRAASSIEVMLKRRHDLIPGLVDTVAQYMEHESDVLEHVTELRAQASGAAPKAEVESQIGQALARIMVTAEAYPELKASDNFQDLQRSLNEVEEQIAASRRAYNAAAQDYNDVVRMFPTNLLAVSLGYRERDYFEIADGERDAIDVGERFRAGRDA